MAALNEAKAPLKFPLAARQSPFCSGSDVSLTEIATVV
jgi:hypothetical protein